MYFSGKGNLRAISACMSADPPDMIKLKTFSRNQTIKLPMQEYRRGGKKG
jgi:hypothetical protein